MPFAMRYPSEKGPAVEIVKNIHAARANHAETVVSPFARTKKMGTKAMIASVCNVEKMIDHTP